MDSELPGWTFAVDFIGPEPCGLTEYAFMAAGYRDSELKCMCSGATEAEVLRKIREMAGRIKT